MLGTPAQEHLQIGPGVNPGQALEGGQVRGDRHAEQITSCSAVRQHQPYNNRAARAVAPSAANQRT